MDTDGFIVHVKADDIYKKIVEDVETWFDISNVYLCRLLPKTKNKKVIGLMKNELRAKIMRKCVGLRAKAYNYLKDNSLEDKKGKDTKHFVIKKVKFRDYQSCLQAAQNENKINHLKKRIKFI